MGDEARILDALGVAANAKVAEKGLCSVSKR